MKKQTITKIISSLLVLVFVISVFELPKTSQAASANLSNYYSNPNRDTGKNPYKFKVSDVVSSNILTSVVGCTGVVNKVSTWMTKMIQSPTKQAAMAEEDAAKMINLMKNACASTKAGVLAGTGAVPTVNDLTSTTKTIFAKIGAKINGTTVKTCQDAVDATSLEEVQALKKQAEKENQIDLKNQCFDGIAITLARNQLTAMTRSAMNWVNSGYGGNPFFVQNMRNFTAGIERNVLETGIDVLLAPNGQQSPYATDFARYTIANRNILSSSSNFLGGLQSSLQNFVTDPQSYYTNNQLDKADNTITALQRSQEANNAFSRSFSSGGWTGWLAFTQMPQNNPLGFNVVANQYLADVEMQQVQEQKDELAQNNGFLSQKSCIKWQIYDANDKPKMKTVASTTQPSQYMNADGTLASRGVGTSNLTLSVVYSTTEPREKDITKDGHGKCVDWKITTPGSIIKEKTTSYLNSPERQLELAKTINDSLNALFSVLISKLQGGGLSGLSDSVVATNWTDNVNRLDSTDGTSTYNNGGAYDGFNLTRDLGNTYIHDDLTPLGTWNAKTNTTNNGVKLYPDLSPEVPESTSADNSYYTVSVAGNTKLILEGYNGWAVGDRAFWDGSKWQNWQKNQKSPIKNRGVIQIQQDYIVAAKEINKVLPNVMTNLGKLDYCIPGPNPSYQTNSTEAQSAYQDWVGSMYVGPKDADRTHWTMDHENDQTYINFKNIFNDNINVWKSISESSSIWLLHHFGRNDGTANQDSSHSCASDNNLGGDHCQNYFYGSANGTDTSHLDNRQKLMDVNLNYTNNNLFPNFYEIFDAMMNKLYFKNMTTKYLEYENKDLNTETDKNPAYIPMAESGLDLTKNIKYYGDDTAKAVKDYTDAIAQAKINVAKLEPIKSDVSKIIIAAQKRRDDNLIKILNAEATRTGGTVLSEAAYKKKYASCLEEENISVFDPEVITGGGNTNATEERCNDGIDNDLNGLVDNNDPACPSYVDPNVSGLKTSGGSTSRR